MAACKAVCKAVCMEERKAGCREVRRVECKELASADSTPLEDNLLDKCSAPEALDSMTEDNLLKQAY